MSTGPIKLTQSTEKNGLPVRYSNSILWIGSHQFGTKWTLTRMYNPSVNLIITHFFQCLDSARYFLDRLDVIFTDSVPEVQDILR